MPTYLTDWIARLPLPRNYRVYGLSNDFPRHGFYRLLLSPRDRDSFATPTGKFVNCSATYMRSCTIVFRIANGYGNGESSRTDR